MPQATDTDQAALLRGNAARSGSLLQLSPMLAAGVREVAPLFARRGLGCLYAEHHCQWLVQEQSRALERSFHRLYLAAADMLRQGFIVVDAAVHAGRGQRCRLQLRLGGTGRQASSAHIDAALHTLELQVADGEDLPLRGAPRLRRASGTCPAAGAHVEFAALPHAGFLFNVYYVLPHAHAAAAAAAGAVVPSGPARAWLLHADPVGGQSALRAAQAQGWSARLFSNTEQALRRLWQQQIPGALPQLVVLFACDAMPPEQLRRLQQALPADVRCVCAVLADSPWLQTDAEPGFGLCCQPLSGNDWQRWHPANRAVAAGVKGSALPVAASAREHILIVDDDPVSAFIAATMVEAEGFQAHCVDDGVHAEAACYAHEPVAVLMDMDMPGRNGLLSTRCIRHGQRLGSIAPSRIVVCSATAVDGAARLAAEAGADAFVPKPLQRSSLRAQLRPLRLVRQGVCA